MTARRTLLRIALNMLVGVVATGCAVHPPVTPLRYDAVTDPQPVDQAFRQEPPATSPVVDEPDAVTERTLPNGLSIVFVPRHDVSLVTSVLVVKRGAVDLGDAGLGVDEMVHLFANGGVGAHESKEVMEATSAGASFALYASLDSLSAVSRAPREAFVASLRRLVMGAAKAHLSAAEYERHESEWHRLVVARVASAQQGQRRILFGDKSPYGVPLPGRKPLSQGDAQALHDQLFRPAQCALIVVGDVSLEEVMAGAESELGSWEPGTPLPRVDVKLPANNGPRMAIMRRRSLEQEQAFVFARGPEYGSVDALAMAVAAQIAGGAVSSKLWEVLREQGDSYASGVETREGRAATWVTLGGSFAANRALEGTRRVLSSLSDLREGRITEDDVALARTVLSASWRQRLATHQGAALHYADRVARGSPVSSDFPARVARVTREDVVRVARIYFAEPSLHVLFFGDDRWLNVESLGLGGPVILDL